MEQGLMEKAPPQTKEEKAAEDLKKEQEAQAQDRRQAQLEIDKAPKPPAPWLEVRKHIGVGPLAYETKRGLVKAFSGDIIGTFEFETGELKPDGTPVLGPDGQPVKERGYIVLDEQAFTTLFGKSVPISLPLDYLAVKIGEERRKKSAPKPKDPDHKDHPKG